MPSRLLKAKAFFWANTHNFFYGTCILGTFALIPYDATVVFGFDSVASGAIIPPRALTTIVTSACASLYVIAPGYRRPMTIGMAIVAVALLALGQGYTHVALFGVPLTDFKRMAIIMPLAGIGMGLASPA